MRVLITGTGGYLGGVIAKHLSEHGFHIGLVSRNHTLNSRFFPTADKYTVDWTCYESLLEACTNYDCVIHCAGLNSFSCQNDPELAFRVNGLHTAKLVKAAENARVKKFIYLSTAHVYESNLIGDVKVSDCPNNLHPYATSHLMGEKAVLYAANSQSRMDGIILRLSNAIGPPLHPEVECWSLVANNFCKQLIGNRIIQINSPINKQIDFVSTGHICNVLKTLILSNSNSQKVFNIGSGSSLSLYELARAVLDSYQSVFLSEGSIKINHPKSFDSSKSQRFNYHVSFRPKNNDLISNIEKTLLFCSTYFRQITQK